VVLALVQGLLRRQRRIDPERWLIDGIPTH
jgi:hypothetical protein